MCPGANCLASLSLTSLHIRMGVAHHPHRVKRRIQWDDIQMPVTGPCIHICLTTYLSALFLTFLLNAQVLEPHCVIGFLICKMGKGMGVPVRTQRDRLKAPYQLYSVIIEPGFETELMRPRWFVESIFAVLVPNHTPSFLPQHNSDQVPCKAQVNTEINNTTVVLFLFFCPDIIMVYMS